MWPGQEWAYQQEGGTDEGQLSMGKEGPSAGGGQCREEGLGCALPGPFVAHRTHLELLMGLDDRCLLHRVYEVCHGSTLQQLRVCPGINFRLLGGGPVVNQQDFIAGEASVSVRKEHLCGNFYLLVY